VRQPDKNDCLIAFFKIILSFLMLFIFARNLDFVAQIFLEITTVWRSVQLEKLDHLIKFKSGFLGKNCQSSLLEAACKNF
jgi:hypothetical protein